MAFPSALLLIVGVMQPGFNGMLGDRLHDLRGDGTINPNAPNTDA